LTPTGAGILYQFDAPLTPGTYRISFCYCGKPLNGTWGSSGMAINLVLTNSYSCNVANDHEEPTPNPVGGEQQIYSNTFNPYNEGGCHAPFYDPISVSNLTFTISQPYSQLWIYGEQVGGGCFADGRICIDDIILESLNGVPDCTEEMDTTACAEEDDYGFIAIKCPGAHYEWDFPNNSTASEYTSDDFSVIVNASEGTYSVTITDDNGCVEERTYEIVEDCCPALPCELGAPKNVSCTLSPFGTIRLTWDPVPDAIGYNVNIEPNSPNGGCCEGLGTQVPAQFTTNTYLDLDVSYLCAAWNVTAVCKGGGESPPSEYACLGKDVRCRQHEETDGEGDGRTLDGPSGNQFSTENIKVFPNPAQDQLNIQWKAELTEQGNVQIRVLDLLGKEVYSRSVDAENFQHSMSTSQWPSGLYFLQLKSGNRLMLSKEITIVR